MRFAIVIATYHRPNGKTLGYIKRAIESVNKQTYKEWDLILVGDKYEPIEELYEIGKMVNTTNGNKVFILENKITERDYIFNGHLRWFIAGATSMNLGLNEARKMGYTHYCHLDDDDEWGAEHLANFNDVFTNYPKCIFAYSKSTYINHCPLPREHVASIHDNNLMVRGGNVIHSAVCFRIDVLKCDYYTTFDPSKIYGPSDFIMWNGISDFIHGNIDKYSCIHIPKITCFKYTEEEAFRG